jgi:hypothetical protein
MMTVMRFAFAASNSIVSTKQKTQNANGFAMPGGDEQFLSIMEMLARVAGKQNHYSLRSIILKITENLIVRRLAHRLKPLWDGYFGIIIQKDSKSFVRTAIKGRNEQVEYAHI